MSHYVREENRTAENSPFLQDICRSCSGEARNLALLAKQKCFALSIAKTQRRQQLSDHRNARDEKVSNHYEVGIFTPQISQPTALELLSNGKTTPQKLTRKTADPPFHFFLEKNCRIEKHCFARQVMLVRMRSKTKEAWKKRGSRINWRRVLIAPPLFHPLARIVWKDPFLKPSCTSQVARPLWYVSNE